MGGADLAEQKGHWHRFKMEGGQSEIEQKQQDHIEEIPSSSKQLEMQIFQKHKKNIQPPKTQKQFVIEPDVCWVQHESEH